MVEAGGLLLQRLQDRAAVDMAEAVHTVEARVAIRAEVRADLRDGTTKKFLSQPKYNRRGRFRKGRRAGCVFGEVRKLVRGRGLCDLRDRARAANPSLQTIHVEVN